MKTTIKTIDIVALEWFDRINGNSYFAGSITLNFGTKEQKNYYLPFQYGYGDHYKDMAMHLLIELGEIKDAEKYAHGGYERLWSYCEKRNIIVRTSKHENCLKRELKEFTKLAEKQTAHA